MKIFFKDVLAAFMLLMVCIILMILMFMPIFITVYFSDPWGMALILVVIPFIAATWNFAVSGKLWKFIE